MKYLFFDIEASEGRSMCSFGYVLTDENFNILKKEDILINPEARFCTQAWSRKKRDEGKGITLAYPEKTFRNSPNFPTVSPYIRDILEHDDQLIVGFSHANDVRYLCTACKRYRVPFFSYNFFDIQDVYREYKHVPDQISLEHIIEELGISIDGYTLHKSDDDAEISMLVAKAICEHSNISMLELTEQYNRYLGNTHDGEIKYRGIDSERAALKKARNACRGVIATYANNIKIPFVKGSPLNKKTVCVGSKVEKDCWLFCLKLIACLAAKGAKFGGNIKEADYYVRFYPNEGEKGDRLYFIQKNIGDKIKIIDKSELYSLMNMTEAEIMAFTNPKIERLRTQNNKYVLRLIKEIHCPDQIESGNKLADGMNIAD